MILMTMAATGRRIDTAQALAQWRHPVDSGEALDVLHQAMRPAFNRRIRMAIKMASNWLYFLLLLIHCHPPT